MEVRAVEFDWLFGEKEGEEFMKELAATDNIELFSLRIIQYIVRYQWKYFKRMIMLRILLPFALYFVFFLVYATHTLHEKGLAGGDTNTAEYKNNFALLIVSAIFWLFFCYIEVKQVLTHRLNYFGNFWNAVDLLSLLLNLSTFVLDLAEINSQDTAVVASFAVLLMWIRLFYFLRLFSTTGMTTLSTFFTVTSYSGAHDHRDHQGHGVLCPRARDCVPWLRELFLYISS